ncbi:hypothetical protein Tco_0262625, partial [Tanacetum coccineum]
MKGGFRGVPRPLLPAMLPVVVVDQSAGQANQAVDQPSPSKPLPSSSHPPVISATTESEHTHQPSPEHQPLSPRQETKILQSQDPTHPHVAEATTMTMDDLLHLVPKLISKVDSLETKLKQTKLTMGYAIVKLVKKVKKMEAVLKRRHVVLPDSEDEDAENSSKQGRNLQEEGLDEMVRNIMKDKEAYMMKEWMNLLQKSFKWVQFHKDQHLQKLLSGKLLRLVRKEPIKSSGKI